MIVGVPRELKDKEYRVGLVPAAVRALTAAGHRVVVEAGAGAGAGFDDDAYRASGAEIRNEREAVWDAAELVVKVKELQPAEYGLPHPRQILFCFQHLGPEPALLDAMSESGASCLAYETVEGAGGSLPILAPMSRIAGSLAPQMGAWALQTNNGGAGVLLGGLPGSAAVPPASVVVAGAGGVGGQAAGVAAGMGAEVVVFARSGRRLAGLHKQGGRIATRTYEAKAFEDAVAKADLVIGAVLVPGRLSPKLISRSLLRRMRPGSVLVEVGIDQGGIAETSRPTSHSAPLYMEEGVVHYCVPNMPAVVPRTATLALSEAVLPYVLALAGRGLHEAVEADRGLRAGLQVHAGRIVDSRLAEDTGRC